MNKQPDLPAQAPIYRALRQTSEEIRQYVERRLGRTALTPPHLFFLEQLARAGGSLPLGDMARDLGCAPSNITQLADRMEQHGLVRREHDTADRRRVLAVLTPLGAERLPLGMATLERLERRLRRAVSPDSATLLLTALARLRKAAAAD